jgi:hypothetical protein
VCPLSGVFSSAPSDPAKLLIAVGKNPSGMSVCGIADQLRIVVLAVIARKE